MLGRAGDCEELAPNDATSLAAEAGPAIFLLRWMISGLEIDERVATAVVDEVVTPLLRRRRR